MDIEGNIIEVGDIVYTSHPVRLGSNSPRLLRCIVLSLTPSGAKCRLQIIENGREINKTSACVVKPLQ